MEHAYAQALWKAVEGAAGRPGMKPRAAVEALRKVLEHEGRIALLPRIARSFARLAERESNASTMVLTVAREKDGRRAMTAAKKALSSVEADDLTAQADLKMQVDDSLIGGWRLEGRGMLIDQSYKNALLDIYQRVISA